MEETQHHRLVVRKPLVPSWSVIDDVDERRIYMQQLRKDWGGDTQKRTTGRCTTVPPPGCQPKSLSRDDLASHIFTNEFLITLKSDGVRYTLYLTTRPTTCTKDPCAVALMIGRNSTMYEIEVAAPEDFFTKGTILEGELVWKQPGEVSMIFLVFDCVRLKGDVLINVPFRERIQMICANVNTNLDIGETTSVAMEDVNGIQILHYNPPFTLRVKDFVERKYAAKLWINRHHTDVLVDGLIMYRADAYYQPNSRSNNSCFKWKERATIDLSGPQLKTSDELPLPGTLFNRSLKIDVKSRIVPQHDDSIIEYTIYTKTDEILLFAIRNRPDKISANSLKVVKATISDVMEELSVEEISGEVNGNKRQRE